MYTIFYEDRGDFRKMTVNDLQTFIEEANWRFLIVLGLFLNAFLLMWIAFYKKSRRSK